MLKDTRFLLVNEDIRIPGTNLFWGFDIDILFHPIPEKTIRFRWYRENNNKTYDIYIMDDQWNYIQRPNEKPDAQGDKKNYYCFNVGSSLSNIVETIANDPEVGAIYKGKVVRIMSFGAFVEIAPGKDGLVHISKLDKNRVENVEDVVSIGDEIVVKVVEIDKQGRINLSRKDALADIEAKKNNA